MEEGVKYEFRDCFEEALGFGEADIGSYSPLVLAYVGDTVFDLMIKSMVVNEGNRQVQKIHERASRYVQASAQSQMMRVIQPLLSEEEHAVFRRGRNTKSVTPAKNQSITDYRRATGFGRLVQLVKIGLDETESAWQ